MSYGGSSGGSGRIATSTDVALNNPADDQVLTYDASTAKWKNVAINAAGAVQTTGGGVEVAVTVSSGSNYVVNLASGNLFVITLTANCALTFSGATASAACSITLMLKQDSNGTRTVSWPSSVKWSGATAPTLSTAAGKVDFAGLLTVDGGTTWYGFVSGLNY